MGIAKAKSKRDSTCSQDGCDNKITEGSMYLWDFTNSKAYCLSHEDLNNQVEEKSYSKGGNYYKLSLGQAPEVLALALELGDTILKRIEGTVEPRDQLVMIESIFKTLSQSYKGE